MPTKYSESNYEASKKNTVKKEKFSLPMVTVVTVSKNAADDLQRTVESVAIQNYPNLEYVVVDGNSSDDSVSILKNYKKVITKWVSEPDHGIYNAMNKAVFMSTGEWIIFINAGDVFHESDVILQAFSLKNQDADIIFGDRIKKEVDGRTIYETAGPIDDMFVKEVVYHQATLIKRKLLLERPYSENYLLASDYEYMVYAYNQGFKFSYIPIAISIFEAGGISRKYCLLAQSEAASISLKYIDRNRLPESNFLYSLVLNSSRIGIGKKASKVPNKEILKNEKNILVSIVTINLDNLVGLKNTIQSVIKQKEVNTQFIVIDGGSLDGSVEYVKTVRNNIDVFICEKDEGIYDAMNKGLNNAQGDYTIFMNSGDSFANSYALTKLLNSRVNIDDEVLYGDRIYLSQNKSEVLEQSRPIETIKVRMPFGHQSMLCNTEILKKFGGFNKTFRFAADYDLVVRLYKAGITFKQTNITVCKFQSGGASESGIRPYLEVMKIQMDNFLPDEIKNSHYIRAFRRNSKLLFSKYFNLSYNNEKSNLENFLNYVDVNQVLAAEKYYAECIAFENKSKALQQRYKDLTEGIRFPARIDENIGSISEKYDFFFFKSLSRADYDEFFKEVADQAIGKVIRWDKKFDKKSRSNILGIKAYIMCFPVFRKIKAESYEDKLLMYYRFCSHWAVLMDVCQIKCRTFVSFSSMQPVENLLTQYYQYFGTKTVTLQHGLYTEYTDKKTVNRVNYEIQPSAYFLAWGRITKELIQSYHPDTKFFVCGKPIAPYIHSNPKKRNKNKSVGVILDQKLFMEENLKMLEIAANYCSKIGAKLAIRFHPSIKEMDFFSNIKIKKYMYLIEQKDNIFNGLFVIGHTSSLMFEVYEQCITVFKYNSKAPCIPFPKELTFETLEELEILVKKSSINDLENSRGIYIAKWGQESKLAYKEALFAINANS